MQGGRAHPQGEELTPRASSSPRTAWVVTFWSMISILRVGSGHGFPVVAERDHLAGLGGLGEVGVGVDQVVGAGVLGEEGQHRAGPLGAFGHVVLLEHGVVAPVHDGVEVQVEDRLLAFGKPRGDHLRVQAARKARWCSCESR